MRHDPLTFEIINFKDEHDKHAIELFYRSVFHTRKEFDYARLPTWSHRYSLEKESIKRLAVLDGKIIGSLGLISYDGYINGQKKKIGFFVDNCVLPEHHQKYEGITMSLFENIERAAKKIGVQVMLGWEYTTHTTLHKSMYEEMGYLRVDGINWFGGGTKHAHVISIEGFDLPLIWKVGLRVLSLKHHIKEALLKPLQGERIRLMNESDIPEIVQLINSQNEKIDFSSRYTPNSLRESISKYNANGMVAQLDDKIIGVLITFFAPWSGWMYGKPTYDKRYGFFLMKHPLEFAVVPKHAEKLAAHLLFRAMSDPKKGKYLLFVDLFDRRIEWMRKAYFDTGADELSFDYGTALFKSLSGKKIIPKNPIYMPTNLVISPYATKDY